MLSSISEVVSGAETIRAYRAGGHFEGETNATVKRRADAQIRTNVIGAFLFPSGEVFSVLTVGAVVAVGVWRGPDSGLTAGAMIGFVFLTYRFLEPIAEFTEVLDQTQTAVAGLRRVFERARHPGRPAATDRITGAAAGTARHRRPRRDVLVSEPGRPRPVRRHRPASHQPPHPGRPTGRDGRGDGLGQDHPRPSDRALRRSDRR